MSSKLEPAIWSHDTVQQILQYLVLTRTNYLPIGYFRCVKIQLDNEAKSTQTKDMKHTSFDFFCLSPLGPRLIYRNRYASDRKQFIDHDMDVQYQGQAKAVYMTWSVATISCVTSSSFFSSW